MSEIDAGELHTADRESFFKDTTDLKFYRRVRDTNANELLEQIIVAIGPNAAGAPVNIFSQIAAVAAGAQTSILTYTVPPGETLVLIRVDMSGQNIGTYDVMVNGVSIARKRTYFSGPFSESVDFGSHGSPLYAAGSVVTVSVLHNRPSTADFEARLQGALI